MTRRAGVLVMTAILLWPSRPVDAGPITFLTALPVPQSQTVIRGQYFLIRAIMRTDVDCRKERRRTPVVGTLVLIAVGLLAATRPTTADQAPEGEEKQAVVTVKGMQCPFCAYGIKKHLGKLPGATRVDVELATNEATVTFEADAEVTDEQIEEAVRKAGFTPADITWQSGDEPKETSGAGAIDARVDTK